MKGRSVFVVETTATAVEVEVVEGLGKLGGWLGRGCEEWLRFYIGQRTSARMRSVIAPPIPYEPLSIPWCLNPDRESMIDIPDTIVLCSP